ncbi:MAG: hypothetical protein Q8S31_09235 [Alphaproteobacteria bacterium]|nr:hypothetical protein [Alphaproteobacteria bacterium]
MSFKKSLSSTFARIAFSLFLTSTAFAAPNDMSFEVSQDGVIVYSHDHLENYQFQSIVETLFGKDISWSLLNTLSNHKCNGLEDQGNMYVQDGVSYTYDSKLIRKNLPWSYSYQKTNAAPKLVKAVFNLENESFDLTYQYYYGLLKGRGYYDFTVRVKIVSFSEMQQAYFNQIKNIAKADQSNIIVETKKEKPIVDIKFALGMNVSQTDKILNSISSLEEELQQLDETIELKQNNDELKKILIILQSLKEILSSEEVQLSALNDIIELGRSLIFDLESLLFTNNLINADWYLYVLQTNNQIADKFKEKQDDDAKKFEVMRSLEGALDSLVDRLDVVARIVAEYQFDEDSSDSEGEEEIVENEQVVSDEQGENGSDNIIIIPPIAPPAPVMNSVLNSNASEQKGDMLAQIRAGTTLKKLEPQEKLKVTKDLASIIQVALQQRNLALKNNEESDSEDDSWSFSDEE